jgi:hypothetical protein
MTVLGLILFTVDDELPVLRYSVRVWGAQVEVLKTPELGTNEYIHKSPVVDP